MSLNMASNPRTTIARPNVLWACMVSVAIGCGPSTNTASKRPTTSPATSADVPDPFKLPDYTRDGTMFVPVVVLMQLLEPSFDDPKNRHLEAYRCTAHGSSGGPEGYPTTYSVRAFRGGDEGLVLVVKIAPDPRCRKRLTLWTARGTPDQWKELVRRVEKSGLWINGSTKSYAMDFDGFEWTLEGLSNRRHEALTEQVPRKGHRVYSPCAYLFALAGGFAEPICD